MVSFIHTRKDRNKTEMKESATMTAQTEAKKSTQVSATIAPEKYAALEDYRWENRINKLSEVVSEAVDTFIAAKGLKVATPSAAPEKAPAKA